MERVTILVFMLLINVPTRAQTDRLKLTTEITNQRYCGTDYSDLAMLTMSLKLTYLNDTSKTLILYEGSNLISYILIAPDVTQIRDKQYEMNMHVGWLTSGGKLREGNSPGNEFAILRPGDSFHTNADTSVPVALEPGAKFLKSGDHVLQVVIETWPADQTVLDRLRKKWERTGYLWANDMRSDPMPLNVSTKPDVVPCK
jgi:hypothetical protein